MLESKRLGALNSIEKEKQPFLCAPFERKDLIGIYRHITFDLVFSVIPKELIFFFSKVLLWFPLGYSLVLDIIKYHLQSFLGIFLDS